MIDLEKQYRTKGGREVRIYATDGKYPFIVQGAIQDKNGEWEQVNWTKLGNFNLVDGCQNDLVEVKQRIKRTIWLNIYEYCFLCCSSKEEADHYDGDDRLACVKVDIDCEESEGL
jgi:hypothetical protein